MDSGKIKKVFDYEIKKDLNEIERDKNKFINEIKLGLGKQINDFNTYVKDEPKFSQKLKNVFNKIFRAL